MAQCVRLNAPTGFGPYPASLLRGTRSRQLRLVGARLATTGISCGGEGAELLSSLDQIVLNSQLSNLAGYMPTDCPTREKVRLKKLFFQKTDGIFKTA